MSKKEKDRFQEIIDNQPTSLKITDEYRKIVVARAKEEKEVEECEGGYPHL